MGSEKARENIRGEENERWQCVCRGLEEIISNKNAAMLQAHCQSPGTFIVLSVAQHILGIAVLFNHQSAVILPNYCTFPTRGRTGHSCTSQPGAEGLSHIMQWMEMCLLLWPLTVDTAWPSGGQRSRRLPLNSLQSLQCNSPLLQQDAVSSLRPLVASNDW